MPLKPWIAKAINFEDLSRAEAEQAMGVIMGGEATQAQIGSYLTALRMKGETVDEIAGSAQAMRANVVKVEVPHDPDEILLDVVGTGGDGKHTFNVSTTAAFVAAGAGVKVAKHGNRAASSRSGSADLLMALGANLELTPQQVAECVAEVGFGFLYAIRHHPAMRFAIGPRRELAQRTIFNILGPLTNPAGATHLFIGVFDPSLTRPLAEALGALGAKAAFVAHGAGGLDELSALGENQISYWDGSKVSDIMLDPQKQFDMPRSELTQLVGGTPEENAQISLAILGGEETGARRDITLLNAAAALSVADNDWERGMARARQSLESGAALAALQKWVKQTNKYR